MWGGVAVSRWSIFKIGIDSRHGQGTYYLNFTYTVVWIESLQDEGRSEI